MAIGDPGLPKAPKGANRQTSSNMNLKANPSAKHNPSTSEYRRGATNGGTTTSNGPDGNQTMGGRNPNEGINALGSYQPKYAPAIPTQRVKKG